MQESNTAHPRIYVQGVRVDNIDAPTALDTVKAYTRAEVPGVCRTIVFTNVHTIHLSRSNISLLNSVNGADLVLPDGSGLKIAGRLYRRPIVENLNGTDFTPRVLAEAEKGGWKVYLLGGRPDVIGTASKRLLELFPALRVVGAHQGHFDCDEEQTIIEEINMLEPDILLVGMGSPIQEQWITSNAPRLRVKASFAVGGFFDFLAGDKRRAPAWIRRIGAEWLFRFSQDPATKWQRVFIEIPVFMVLLLAGRVFPAGSATFGVEGEA
jgi:N-acetylglucosaminyldiphosphoundecaprenol N-acetyl-beta-D-mannosaminyltransferase